MPGSGLREGELDGLVGRDGVVDRVCTLLGEGERTVVLFGIPGSGKTTVCGEVARRAARDGTEVVSFTCHPSERGLAFAVLDEVLQAAGIGSTSAGDLEPLPLRRRALGVLTDRPLLVMVDDAQWCDESSIDVLGFVARRLAGTGTSVLLSFRGDEPPRAVSGSPTVDLPPLPDIDARRLLTGAGIELHGPALLTVLERAAGNPLALLELGRAAQRLTSGALLPSSVEVSFEDQIQGLPPLSRSVLLLAAACDGDMRALGGVLPASLLDDLAPAERAGLVRVAQGRLEFRHPLVRSAAYNGATTAERLAAHQQLAEAYADEPERRLWHLAEATVVPDEPLAAQLEDAADRLRSRGAASEAARMMHRAGTLSPDRAERERRLLQAVLLFSVAGRFDWAVELGSVLRDESPDETVRVGAAHTVAYALSQTERSSVARNAVIDVLGQLLRIDVFWGWSMLTTYAVLVYRSGEDPTELGTWLDRYEEATEPGTPLDALVAALRTYVRTQIDILRRDEAELAFIREAATPDLPRDLAGTFEMALGAAAFFTEEPRVAITRLQRAADLMRRAEAPGELPQTLQCLGLAHFEVGDVEAAEEAARASLELVESRSLTYRMVDGLELLMRAAAVRGDVAEARRQRDRVRQLLAVGESRAHEAHLRVSMGWVRWAEGDLPGSWAELQWLFEEDGTPLHVRLSHRSLGDYVAAARRAGATDQVAAVVDRAAARLRDAGPLYRLQVARSRALLAGEDAEPWHLQATTDPAARTWPFDLACARLEHGVWLRRRHRQTEARLALREALTTFERVGARPWETLARSELRAAGVVAEGSTAESAAWASLTGQEREVVRLAALGRTNPEIAAALHLSPRTVSTHLYNAFPKLGVTSRAQLRDVVPEVT